MKIAVLDAHDENYEEIARLIYTNRRSYCGRHGYDFICHRFGALDRTPHWGRVLASEMR